MNIQALIEKLNSSQEFQLQPYVNLNLIVFLIKISNLAKRPDRDQYVEIDWANVRDGMDHNFMKLNAREWLNISIPYDTGSVLHYSGYAFAKDKSKPTMVHKGLD